MYVIEMRLRRMSPQQARGQFDIILNIMNRDQDLSWCLSMLQECMKRLGCNVISAEQGCILSRSGRAYQ